jgi:hypothetical protein
MFSADIFSVPCAEVEAVRNELDAAEKGLSCVLRACLRHCVLCACVRQCVMRGVVFSAYIFSVPCAEADALRNELDAAEKGLSCVLRSCLRQCVLCACVRQCVVRGVVFSADIFSVPVRRAQGYIPKVCRRHQIRGSVQRDACDSASCVRACDSASYEVSCSALTFSVSLCAEVLTLRNKLAEGPPKPQPAFGGGGFGSFGSGPPNPGAPTFGF